MNSRVSEAFRHCPACGKPRSGPIGGSPLVCAECGFTYYFASASATAVFVRRTDGRMLFVRRARDPGKGLLAPPGGFIDVGERVEDALRREIREEVGLEIADPVFLASFPNTYPYRGLDYPVLDLFFVANALHPESAQALDDVEALCWRGLSEVAEDELAFPSMKAALRVLRSRSANPSSP